MSDKDCLFCKIIAGEIPSEKVYEDDATYAFKDINPKAKVHVLIVLKNGIIIPKLARVRYRGARTMPRNAGTVPYFCCRYPCLIHTSNGLSQQPEEE